MIRAGLMAVGTVALVAACDQQMVDMPRNEPYEASAVLPEQASVQPPVPGTVARGTLLEPRPDNIPVEIDAALLHRGQERFDIFCSPCHGRSGDGNGMIVQRGFPQPPSYHIDRLRRAPDSHFYDVMTNGFGAMYSYASRVPPDDRWAIAAYIRALQLSRHAVVAELPDDVEAHLPEQAP